jgi:hypothetical protein
MSLELVPHDGVDIDMGVVVCLPPVGCCPKELVCGKKNFLVVCALGDHELLLNSLKPIFGFQWVFSLGEGGGASSQKLSQTRLVWWQRWRCLLMMFLMVGLQVVEGLQYDLHQLILHSNQLLEVDRVVGVVVVGLAVALVVPCVHHLMVDWTKV